MERYDSYKDSGVEWIGMIPKSWNITPLYSISYNTKEKNSDKCDTVLSLSYGRIVERNVEKNHGLLPSNFDSYQRIRPDYVVLRLTDLQNDKKSLRVGYSELDGIITSVYVSLGTKENYNGRYLYYQLHNSDIKKVLYSLGSGLRQSLRYDELKRFPLLRISLFEQQQIVSFLDTKTSLIDSLIEKTQRKIELLREKRTSLINEVVTKGLNPNVEMKDSGVEWIGKIPTHYQMTSIKFLVTTPVSDGPHETPQFIDEGGIPFLSVEGVVGNKIDFEKVRGYISEELHEQYSKKCKPLRNDVLLVKSGSTTGKSTIVETDLEFNIWSPLCVIRSNTKKIIPRFTFQTFQSGYFRLLIENNWSYGTQPNIGMGVIENLRIVVPPLTEQQQIVEYLDEQTQKIDKTISIEEKRIELLKEYRQSLISEVVTGKRKVVE